MITLDTVLEWCKKQQTGTTVFLSPNKNWLLLCNYRQTFGASPEPVFTTQTSGLRQWLNERSASWNPVELVFSYKIHVGAYNLVRIQVSTNSDSLSTLVELDNVDVDEILIASAFYGHNVIDSTCCSELTELSQKICEAIDDYMKRPTYLRELKITVWHA